MPLQRELLEDEKVYRLHKKEWRISKATADQLHKNILNSEIDYQINKKNYNVLGEDASIPKSGDYVRESAPQSADATSKSIESSSNKLCGSTPTYVKAALSPSGQSCFTWARDMLDGINEPQIKQSFPRSPFDLIAAKPSHHIPGDEHSSCKII